MFPFHRFPFHSHRFADLSPWASEWQRRISVEFSSNVEFFSSCLTCLTRLVWTLSWNPGQTVAPEQLLPEFLHWRILLFEFGFPAQQTLLCFRLDYFEMKFSKHLLSGAWRWTLGVKSLGFLSWLCHADWLCGLEQVPCLPDALTSLWMKWVSAFLLAGSCPVLPSCPPAGSSRRLRPLCSPWAAARQGTTCISAWPTTHLWSVPLWSCFFLAFLAWVSVAFSSPTELTCAALTSPRWVLTLLLIHPLQAAFCC